MRDGFTTPWQFLRNVAVRAAYRLTPMAIRRRAYHAIVDKRNGALESAPEQPEPPKRGRHSAPDDSEDATSAS